MRRIAIVFFITLLSSLSITGLSQPVEQIVKIIVAPNHANWQYEMGENATFSISVLQYGNPVPNVKIKYEIGQERMKPGISDSAVLSNGTKQVNGGTLKTPGFLRCIVTAVVDGKIYRNLATAGYAVTRIQPVIEMPADFADFWNKGKEELSHIPIDARMVLLPERCTENVNVYHVNIQNTGGARLYGILCVPKKEGKYPALLKVPGAGVRSYKGDVATAEKGIITFEIGIHGIPVTMDDIVYSNLAAGALNGYQNFNLDDKNRFYYKRVYLGCVRANDFLTSLPQYDGTRLGVSGGSQGGALSIVTASLDSRVKYLAAFYPALCDLTGDLKGRAGGWPHYFENNNYTFNNKPDKILTCGYYDVVNFARRLNVEGNYAWGYNDEVCPPTSMYAAYNAISAPKQLFLALETGHWNYPEETEKLYNWISNKLLIK